MDERALIRLAGEIIGEEQVADDCAVIRRGDECLVLSTDMLHETTDFPAGMTDWQIGWMAVAVTLSDIAAMGAAPDVMLLAIGLDRWERFEGIMRGAQECCTSFGCRLIGGDIDAHPELTIVSTGLGTVSPASLVRRTGAMPGDLLALTGTPGRAQAGLEGFAAHREALLVPRPSVREGWLLGRAGATAMMDVSDGLVLSLYDLLGVNEAGFSVTSAALPLASGVPEARARKMALYGGGDFGLLFSIPSDRFPVDGVEASVIGQVIPGQVVLVDGIAPERRGYVHRWAEG